MLNLDSLWCEKYRPTTLKDIILTDNNASIVQKFYNNKEIPNLLFIGHAGIGKTSLAKLLVKDALQCQYLYINASDENGIDTIRTKVTSFSKVKSIDGNIKVIILDEVDGLTLDAQRALRNTMEEYSLYTRFILTANYNHKVIPPLQSRCQTLDLVPPVDLCISRVKTILQSEGIIVSDETKLEELVRQLYPDLRKVINEVQKNSIGGKLTIRSNKSNIKLIAALFELVKNNNILKARKYIIQNETTFNSDYTQLLKELFNYIDGYNSLDQKSICLLTVSEYMYRMSFVVDPEINFYSCLIQLSSNLLKTR